MEQLDRIAWLLQALDRAMECERISQFTPGGLFGRLWAAVERELRTAVEENVTN
jgi:hypothetical protein